MVSEITKTIMGKLFLVLILVLMEDGLRDIIHLYMKTFLGKVLILVLMEDGLRVFLSLLLLQIFLFCLNPCSYGRWSQRRDARVNTHINLVLILVLMEDGLRVLLNYGKENEF